MGKYLYDGLMRAYNDRLMKRWYIEYNDMKIFNTTYVATKDINIPHIEKYRAEIMPEQIRNMWKDLMNTYNEITLHKDKHYNPATKKFDYRNQYALMVDGIDFLDCELSKEIERQLEDINLKYSADKYWLTKFYPSPNEIINSFNSLQQAYNKKFLREFEYRNSLTQKDYKTYEDSRKWF